MSVIRISAKNNDNVKQVGKLLCSPSYRRSCGEYAVEGLRICVDALESGLSFDRIFATERFMLEHTPEYERLSSKAVRTYIITDDIMKKISDTVSPQGVLGVLKIHEHKPSLTDRGRYLVLVNTQNPANLGACARTAEALGLSALLVCGGCDIYNPKALRASMGAFFRMKVGIYSDVKELIGELRANNIKSYASVPRADAQPLYSIDFNDGCAVLIGNEAKGLDDNITALCDSMITIPMAGRAESLNAHAAAAILCYEMMKGAGSE